MKKSSERKSKIIIFFLIAVIILFFVGIVYQFVVIKQLESQVAGQTQVSLPILNIKNQIGCF